MPLWTHFLTELVICAGTCKQESTCSLVLKSTSSPGDWVWGAEGVEICSRRKLLFPSTGQAFSALIPLSSTLLTPTQVFQLCTFTDGRSMLSGAKLQSGIYQNLNRIDWSGNSGVRLPMNGFHWTCMFYSLYAIF